VVRATALIFAGNGAGQLLRLISNLILSRLLFPEAFGLIAIVSMINTGLQMFSNVGVKPAIIRHEHGDEQEFLDTAWTLQVLRGFFLWLIGTLLALPAATFYHQEGLVALIPVASAVAILDGFASTKLITLTRRLELGRTVAIRLISKLVSLVMMVALAWAFRSVWALVAGSLVQAAIRTLLTHVAIPGVGNRFRWHPGHGRELLSFGKWILLSTAFTFMAQRVDVFILARKVPMDLLGVYSIGILISGAARVLTGRFVQNVLMASLSEAQRTSPDRLRANLRTSKRLVLPGGVLICLAGVAASPAFFYYLYDPRYWGAGWIAQLSMAVLWFGLLQEANGRALLAIGDSRSLAWSNAVRTVVAGVGCVVGIRWLGVAGALLGMAGGAAAAWGCVAVALRSHEIGTSGHDIAATAVGLGLAGLCVVTPHWLASAPWPGTEDLARLAPLTLIVGFAMLIPLGARFGIHAWRTLIRRT